jgi:hypothetical protein
MQQAAQMSEVLAGGKRKGVEADAPAEHYLE